MLKEAALLTLDLCIRLAEKELTLQDAHPWNILFDGHHPVFIDLGSITPVRPDIIWAPYQHSAIFSCSLCTCIRQIAIDWHGGY